MTVRNSLFAALGIIAFAGVWIPQASHAAVARVVINIPKVTVPVGKFVVPGKPSVGSSGHALPPQFVSPTQNGRNSANVSSARQSSNVANSRNALSGRNCTLQLHAFRIC